MRYLLENTELADEVLGESLDGFLTEIHGDPVAAWALAARSYLDSGYFDEARGALGEALARDPTRADLRRALAYADGHDRVPARSLRPRAARSRALGGGRSRRRTRSRSASSRSRR